MKQPEAVLTIENLRVVYAVPGTQGKQGVRAVNHLSFALQRGERLGLVGESGSGKSTTALAILRILPQSARSDEGRIYLDNQELLTLDEEAMRAIRWRRIALVPQGAMNSLNPVLRIYHQMADVIREHEGRVATKLIREQIGTALEQVDLAASVMDLYPHQLSGGMKQRVCIAMAILLKPQVIIADEPTSALDVVTQQVVAQTLMQVQEQIGASILLIGHDMGLQAQLVDRLAVMYAGHLVEIGPVGSIFHEPLHPYTQSLISFIPTLREKRPPRGLAGLPPRLLGEPTGCVFRARCPVAIDRCQHEVPPLREVRPGHQVACHLP
jgi:peptide/nickel transport system ATP-binding protein